MCSPSIPEPNEDTDVASALWRRLQSGGDDNVDLLANQEESSYNTVMDFDELARALQEQVMQQQQGQQQERQGNVYLGDDGAQYPPLSKGQVEFAVNPGFVSFGQPEFKEEEIRTALAEGKQSIFHELYVYQLS